MSRIVLPELPQTWTTVRIGDIARVVYGDALTAEMRNREGGVNVYGSGGIVGKHDISLHPGPSIIIGRKGSVGSIYLETQPFWCIDTAFYLDWISDQIDIEFLFYLLSFLDLRRLAIVVGVPGLNRSDLESSEIPLPTLPEQHRIVAILRQSDELRRLRRELWEQTQQLPSALFLELFGEPFGNQCRWPMRKLGDLCTLVRRSSPRPQGDPRFFGGPVPRLMVADLTRDGLYVTPQIDSLTEVGAKKSRPMKAGEVVMAVSGAPGLAAILSIDACIHDGFVGLRDLSEDLVPEYLVGVLDFFRSRSEQQAVGAIFKNLTTDQVGQWQIPLPPKELQRSYKDFLQQLLERKQFAEKFTVQLEQTYISMFANGFTGVLSASWRSSHLRDLEIAARARDAALGQTNGKAVVTEYAPPAHREVPQPERYWLTNHLGEVQGFVWKALQKWDGTLIPSEDLDSFRQSAPQMEHIEDANDHILRALSQLAGFGLIAQVSVPNQQSEYVVGYRRFREEERILPVDLQATLES